MLLDTTANMIMVNNMTGKCDGGATRIQVRKDGVQSSVIDYVFVSPCLVSKVKRFEIMDQQMGSDHKPLVLALEGITAKQPLKRGLVEVWKVEKSQSHLMMCLGWPHAMPNLRTGHPKQVTSSGRWLP